MFRLPVSGSFVDVHLPGGAEELLLWERREFDRPFALELVGRLTTAPAPENLSVHDFEAVLLQLHRLVFGDAISADATCECGEPVDISFSVSAFLAHRAPRRPRAVVTAGEAGWFSLDGTDDRFRLPTVGDQIAVARERDPLAALAARCVHGSPVPARVDRAIAAMAPALSGPIQGACPHCARTITLVFDVPSFVLRELQVQASLVCEHVHLLAGRYHWSEEKILSLPSWRRQHYVDMVIAERSGAA
jgi:hypothetical protein